MKLVENISFYFGTYFLFSIKAKAQKKVISKLSLEALNETFTLWFKKKRFIIQNVHTSFLKTFQLPHLYITMFNMQLLAILIKPNRLPAYRREPENIFFIIEPATYIQIFYSFLYKRLEIDFLSILIRLRRKWAFRH